MDHTTSKQGPRGGLYQYPLMVRLAATEKNQLEWLAKRRGVAQGTLVRQLVEDGLAVLMARGTPLRDLYDADWGKRRRPTPIEKASRRRQDGSERVSLVKPAPDTPTAL